MKIEDETFLLTQQQMVNLFQTF